MSLALLMASWIDSAALQCIPLEHLEENHTLKRDPNKGSSKYARSCLDLSQLT